MLSSRLFGHVYLKRGGLSRLGPLQMAPVVDFWVRSRNVEVVLVAIKSDVFDLFDSERPLSSRLVVIDGGVEDVVWGRSVLMTGEISLMLWGLYSPVFQSLCLYKCVLCVLHRLGK